MYSECDSQLGDSVWEHFKAAAAAAASELKLLLTQVQGGLNMFSCTFVHQTGFFQSLKVVVCLRPKAEMIMEFSDVTFANTYMRHRIYIQILTAQHCYLLS